MNSETSFSIDIQRPGGSVETVMSSLSTEQFALTNATLLKRNFPGSVCVIRDTAGRVVHQF